MAKKRKKKSESTKVGEKLDLAWAKITKIRAGNKCEICGQTHNLNSHHIFGRKNKSVRWSLSNCCVLCPNHHVFSSYFSAHQTPTAFTLWLIGEHGEKWHDGLMILANAPKKWTLSEKEQMLEEFEEMLKND